MVQSKGDRSDYPRELSTIHSTLYEIYDVNLSQYDVNLSQSFSIASSKLSKKNIPQNPLISISDFPRALKKLLLNRLLMTNIWSGIFYVLGGSGYITYLTKYIEVQFHKSAANASVVTGNNSVPVRKEYLSGGGMIVRTMSPSG